ncbi:MAG: 16S rRNA (guanine(966)-N(2))-methyltransferase RsmD [Anaerolineales bacterium]|nr:16S rRNA (guanine(966)-N(2))-methyltransferase RsmD [Anaerolineae bacterium]PWB50941.1 MAG: 16S rRNA (guanine(966)-N(2))-methyltransferase RsmD [Anaerolineales bacterium]
MSDLRIIGGKARGRRIRSVPGDTTRPITDKVRQALFNIIGPDIVGASFLDLFAGTGSVGIEALSRGAAFVQFNELNRQAYTIIRENLKITGLEQGAIVNQGDAFSLLDRAPNQSFDYIFIAPPQYKEMWSKSLVLIDRQPAWLSDDAWLIVQIHPIEYKPIGEELPLENLVEFDQRHYGSTVLVFYRKDGGELNLPGETPRER